MAVELSGDYIFIGIYLVEPCFDFTRPLERLFLGDLFRLRWL